MHNIQHQPENFISPIICKKWRYKGKWLSLTEQLQHLRTQIQQAGTFIVGLRSADKNREQEEEWEEEEGEEEKSGRLNPDVYPLEADWARSVFSRTYCDMFFLFYTFILSLFCYVWHQLKVKYGECLHPKRSLWKSAESLLEGLMWQPSALRLPTNPPQSPQVCKSLDIWMQLNDRSTLHPCSLHLSLSYPEQRKKLQVRSFFLKCKNVKLSGILSVRTR